MDEKAKSLLRAIKQIRLAIYKLENICLDNIHKGNREKAIINLVSINLILEPFGVEYKSLKDFYEEKTQVFPYVENNYKLMSKKEIVFLMIGYAKSKYDFPSELLKYKCHSYFKALSLNEEEKIKTINGLIVLCMDSCSKEQLKKLDDSVNILCDSRYLLLQ